MHTERELSLCLKLLAQSASDQGDGVVAALMLQDRMERHGLDFEAVLDYLCRHQDDYAYQAENFFSLMGRAQAVWEATEMVVDPSAAPIKATVDDPDDKVSHKPGAGRIKVPEHTRTSRKGKVFTVRSHWRKHESATRQGAWRNDPAATPGDDYEWVGSHERWSCHAGKGRKIGVRGYWRRKPLTIMRKAA